MHLYATKSHFKRDADSTAMKLIVLVLLIGISSAGDWDHLAPQYTHSTWGIMTTAMHSCPGLSEYNLYGDSFVLGVNIAPSEFAASADILESVKILIAAYADCLVKAGETKALRINLYEGGAISQMWDVTPTKAIAAANNTTCMDDIAASGRPGEAMGMLLD